MRPGHLLVAITLLAGVTAAASPPFLLASVQEETELAAPPGGSVTTSLAFSNEGRVPLYILLTPARVAPGWNLTVEPPARPLPGDGFRADSNLRLEPGQTGRAVLSLQAPLTGVGGTLQVDGVAVHFAEGGKAQALLARAFAYDLSLGSGPGGAKKNETIVAGLSDYPIRFGIIVPGRAGNASAEGGFPLRVWLMNRTSVPATLSVRGTDFTVGDLTFPAGQMGVSPGREESGRVPVSTSFQSLFPDWAGLAAGKEALKELYFWLSIPKGQPPGQYANTLTVALSRQGALPASPAVPRTEPLPSPSPTAAATNAPPTPPRPTPGFDIGLALLALATGNVLYRRWRSG